MEQPLQCRQDVEPVRKRKRKRRRRCKRHPQEGPHSPTCRGQKASVSTVTNGPALVRILPQLKPVLDFLEVKGDTFTRAQIMGHLTDYIKKKSLYDPVDPRKVYCDNDQLGDIFGCKEFSTANACDLLLQNLENVSAATNSTESHSSKRARGNYPCPPRPLTSVSTTDTCSCSESDQQSTGDFPLSAISVFRPPGVKRNVESSFSGTGSTSPCLPSTSCVETTESLTIYMQHYKAISENATDVVTDTSDDLFFLNETDEERVVRQFVSESEVSLTADTDDENIVRRIESDGGRFAVEYEPISYSEEERLVAVHGFDTEGTSDSMDTEVDEGEDGGDELGNGDSSDSEIEENDKWQCELCEERNHPMTRRCVRCWSIRQDWFPPTLNRTSSDPGRIQTETPQPQIDPVTVSDSASTSQSRVTPVVPAANDATDSTASETKDSYGRLKCMLCRKAPPDGCIVHGRTGHQVCCLVCAQKLKDDNKPCPVCRKKIGKVIKNFM